MVEILSMLEKWIFPFTSGYQLQITSWLGVRVCLHFPLSVLGPISALKLCRKQESLGANAVSVLHIYNIYIGLIEVGLLLWNIPGFAKFPF